MVFSIVKIRNFYQTLKLNIGIERKNTMRYDVFIDESGQFVPYDNSIVCAVIISKELSTVIETLNSEILGINNSYKTDFDINKDIHIAAVMMPDRAAKPEEGVRFSKIPEPAREAFASGCLKVVQSVSDKIVFSRDSSKTGIDSQGRYGTNLIAVVQSVIDFLKMRRDIEEINILIEPRSRKCIVEENVKWNRYHNELCKYIGKTFQKELPLNCNLNVNVECNNTGFSGCDLADVMAYFLRFNNFCVRKDSLMEAARSEGNFNKILLDSLISRSEYDVAYAYASNAKDKSDILSKLSSINDRLKFEAQLKSFLNIAFNLVDQRTLKADALDEAMQIFNEIENISRMEFDKDKASRGFFDALLASIDGKITCLNHQGAKGQQKPLEAEYISLVKEYPKLTSGAMKRSERTLKLRNRAYNNEFNNYDFDKIIEEFSSEVDTRMAKFRDEPDELTGEMCGTIGQTHAFLARTEKSEVHNEEAEKYFRQSLKHFIPGHKYYKMSVNYLASLFWQKMEYDKAIEAFSMHDKVPRGDKPTQYIEYIISHPEYFDKSTAFDLSVLLKIAAERGKVEKNAIIALERFLDTHKIDDHPYELLYKWMGISYLKWNENKYALSCFDESIRISDKLDFTVKTIALSVVGLRIVTYLRLNDETSANLEQVALIAKLRELVDISSPFAAYIEKIGGEEKLLKDIQAHDILKISSWMPFSYS
jgi:hypothetical protein